MSAVKLSEEARQARYDKFTNFMKKYDEYAKKAFYAASSVSDLNIPELKIKWVRYASSWSKVESSPNQFFKGIKIPVTRHFKNKEIPYCVVVTDYGIAFVEKTGSFRYAYRYNPQCDSIMMYEYDSERPYLCQEIYYKLTDPEESNILDMLDDFIDQLEELNFFGQLDEIIEKIIDHICEN